MTLVIDSTTLCPCLHIAHEHPDQGACSHPGCTCPRFQATARTSAHHYQRGQRTVRKRVARLEPGDAVLVGFPGYIDFPRDPDGNLLYETDPQTGRRQVKTRHVQDHKLRFVDKKTGALVAMVTGRRHEVPDTRSGFYNRRSPVRHIIETDLGDLPSAAGVNSVMVRA